jgi:hypothetical protein
MFSRLPSRRCTTAHRLHIPCEGRVRRDCRSIHRRLRRCTPHCTRPNPHSIALPLIPISFFARFPPWRIIRRLPTGPSRLGYTRALGQASDESLTNSVIRDRPLPGRVESQNRQGSIGCAYESTRVAYGLLACSDISAALAPCSPAGPFVARDSRRLAGRCSSLANTTR